MFSKNPPLRRSDQDPIGSAAYNYKGWREQFVLAALRITCIAGMAFIAFLYSTGSITDHILFFGLYVVLLRITIVPISHNIRAYTLLAINFGIGVNILLARGPWVNGSLFLLIFVVLSALLFDNWIDVFALIASTATTVTIALLQQLGSYEFTNISTPFTTITDWGIYITNFLVAGISIAIAIRLFKNEFIKGVQQTQTTLNTLAYERRQLEERVQERTEELETRTTQLRFSTTVARTVAEIQNISDLMDTATKLTSEQFGYYHVGLYLLDESKKNAFLQAASSTTGKQLVGQGFRIEPDRRNAVHLVVEQNRSHIASDINDANFIREANFPLTRSRMMLPLAVSPL